GGGDTVVIFKTVLSRGRAGVRFAGVFRRNRELQPNRRPLPGRAVYLDRPAVRLHDVFHDRQTQSRPAHVARAAALRPVKALEDPRQILRRDADAVVDDLDDDLLASPGVDVLTADDQSHQPVVPRVLDCVLHQVRYGALEVFGVADDGVQPVGHL